MELLIRTVNKNLLDPRMSMRGDVIAACPDGWGWTDTERAHPEWIIIKADIMDIEADALMEGGRPDEAAGLFRRLGIDIDGLATGDSLTRAELMARVA